MPWRIIGASFVSLEKGEAGWLPGLMGDGYYLVDFDQCGLMWRHADIEDHYACTLGKGGAFEARNRVGTKAEGRVNLARGELVWQGKKYRVRTYEEIAAEKKGQEPALKPTDPESPIKSLDKDTLQIDLKSKQRGSGGLDFAMGGLRVDYLGHQGGWAILRIYTNIELGESLILYRLPVSDGTATIRTKYLPSYSFAKAKSKVIWAGQGQFFGNGIGWTTTAEDRRAPGQQPPRHHQCQRALQRLRFDDGHATRTRDRGPARCEGPCAVVVLRRRGLYEVTARRPAGREDQLHSRPLEGRDDQNVYVRRRWQGARRNGAWHEEGGWRRARIEPGRGPGPGEALCPA